ncbi:MAG: dipeptide ABC transporter ATP-binding protein [Gammaproteobacteria bacterium]|nr:dipeptide ABC transporter ATP-binding protein [Gammaproteobacteria bacterium]
MAKPDPLLEVSNLAVHFGGGDNLVKAVDGVSFSVAAGETLVMVGESGSGKSITAMAISRLLPPVARIESGKVVLAGEDLFRLPEYRMRDIRGAAIGMIFQEPQSSLNPVMTIGAQIGETLTRHKGLRGAALKSRVIELLDAVGIDEPERRLKEYPHQFSGGMKQRVMVAIALAADPKLLIADEPTTALDVTIQAQVLDLIKSQQRRRDMGILFITHDLAVAHQVADNVLVMRNGVIVERGERDAFYSNPQHAYSKQLFDALPSWEKRVREGYLPTSDTRETILSVQGLKVYYPIKKGIFRRTVGYVKAVDGIDLEIEKGRTLAVVGESGSGKTTMGKGILQLTNSYEGTVKYEGTDLGKIDAATLRRLRSDLQIVFQDPYSSMNPRMMVGDIIKEGMIAQGIGANHEERDRRVAELLEQVGLETGYARRYPHEFSGGQRQRICIARALAVEPRLIVCDEPTSALDVSVQAQILELLRALQDRLELTYLFVTHNIGVVAYLAHKVAVMYQGRIVEYGDVEQVLHRPQHDYTRKLLAAVPTIKSTDPA